MQLQKKGNNRIMFRQLQNYSLMQSIHAQSLSRPLKNDPSLDKFQFVIENEDKYNSFITFLRLFICFDAMKTLLYSVIIKEVTIHFSA